MRVAVAVLVMEAPRVPVALVVVALALRAAHRLLRAQQTLEVAAAVQKVQRAARLAAPVS
jgi:hypothetical protein